LDSLNDLGADRTCDLRERGSDGQTQAAPNGREAAGGREQRGLIMRVSSDPGPPLPMTQHKSERLARGKETGIRERGHADRNVASRDSVGWDQNRESDVERVGGRARSGGSDVGAAIGVPPLQWKGRVSAPGDCLPSSMKSVSVASSASQRDALLSGPLYLCIYQVRGSDSPTDG
jgi:hypothetical protein